MRTLEIGDGLRGSAAFNEGVGNSSGNALRGGARMEVLGLRGNMELTDMASASDCSRNAGRT